MRNFLTTTIALATLTIAAPVVSADAPANDQSELTPFTLSTHDTTETFISVANMNQPITTNRVTLSKDAHLQVDGKPIRFIGVNMTFSSAIPQKTNAPTVAGRLAKFGVNSVRFHHIDNDWDDVLIDRTTGDSRHINAKRLDDLHYFISQLKKNGIYADLNLLVTRNFTAKDQFPDEIKDLDWKTRHILGYFNDHALALQKEYATKFLTPVNPYTELPLAQDPAVAFVEIINENGILQKWYENDLDRLPGVFKRQLQTRWNEWLRDHYASTEELIKAWDVRSQTLGENEILDPNFEKGGLKPWNLEIHSGKATLAVDKGHADDINALKIQITEPASEIWHIQLNQPGQKQKKGELRTLSFWAKADKEVSLSTSIMQAHEPYAIFNTTYNNTLTPDWTQFTYTFIVGADEDNLRPNFGGFAQELCTVWISDVQWMTGGTVGNLPENLSLKTGNIPNILHSQPMTSQAQRDWVTFLRDLEYRYFNAMVKHLRRNCNYQGLIFGTILANSPATVQAQMDVVDSHGYWNHPTFPPGKSWNGAEWIVSNSPMTGRFDNTFTSCALQRIAGKPFFCTEYQHPSPNQYCAEGPAIVGAYSAFQDWDGYWFFDYNESDNISGFFTTAGHPAKMANLLLSANLFRRGDVAKAKETITMGMDSERELDMLQGAGAWSIFSASHLGMPSAISLQHGVTTSLDGKNVTHEKAPAAITADTIASDTDELLWNKEPNKSCIQINTPLTKAIIGFTDEQTFQLGDVAITPAKTQLGWSTIAITLKEGDNFRSNAHALITATGRTENTGMQWTSDKKNSVSTNWGSAPVLIETVPFQILLPSAPDKTTVYALDTIGNRKGDPIPVINRDGKACITLDGTANTIWYEVVIK